MIYMFLSNNPSSGDINSSNLPCLIQTLRVFSQMKDVKDIRRDFHSLTWVMPQEWDLGVPWGVGVQKIFPPQIQPDLVCELLT